jgi:hypothetical protein
VAGRDTRQILLTYVENVVLNKAEHQISRMGTVAHVNKRCQLCQNGSAHASTPDVTSSAAL